MASAPQYTLSDALAEYVKLLILQYKGKPKAVATVSLLIQAALADYFAPAVAAAYDLNTAVGPQLDVIGRIVGAARLFTSTLTQNYYGFQNYAGTGNPTGWRNYGGTTNSTGVWFSYQFVGAQNNYLPDSLYRQVIQLQIILNSNDGTLASIMAYLNEFFPGQVSLVDTKQMELIYTVQPTCQIPAQVLQAYLPKPMGVGITIQAPSSSRTRVTSDGSTRVTSDGAIRIVDN